MNNDNTIPAVEKTVALLEKLGKSENGATQAELANELGITQSTCYRILQTLQKHDWVKKNSGSRYDLSGGILAASMKLSDKIRRFDKAQPILDRLANESGLSCKLSIRQGTDQLTILRAESPGPIIVSGKVGTRFPVIEGSVGAALLSGDSEETIKNLCNGCGESIIEKTNPEIVIERINQIREKGYCLNSKQNRWKVEAMSVPLKDNEGNVAGTLTLLGFEDDFSIVNAPRYAEMLKKSAEDCIRSI